MAQTLFSKCALVQQHHATAFARNVVVQAEAETAQAVHRLAHAEENAQRNSAALSQIRADATATVAHDRQTISGMERELLLLKRMLAEKDEQSIAAAAASQAARESVVASCRPTFYTVLTMDGESLEPIIHMGLRGVDS